MKKFAIGFTVGLILVFCAVVLRASPVIIAGSPLTVNNTTTTCTVTAAFSYNPTLNQYTIQHGALGALTDIQVKVYANVTSNTVNAVQIGTWYPTTTNAATEIIPANLFSVTNFTYPTITTTNSQAVYMSYGQ